MTASSIRRCADCASPVEAGDKHCPVCGASLDFALTTAIAPAIDPSRVRGGARSLPWEQPGRGEARPPIGQVGFPEAPAGRRGGGALDAEAPTPYAPARDVRPSRPAPRPPSAPTLIPSTDPRLRRAPPLPAETASTAQEQTMALDSLEIEAHLRSSGAAPAPEERPRGQTGLRDMTSAMPWDHHDPEETHEVPAEVAARFRGSSAALANPPVHLPTGARGSAPRAPAPAATAAPSGRAAAERRGPPPPPAPTRNGPVTDERPPIIGPGPTHNPEVIAMASATTIPPRSGTAAPRPAPGFVGGADLDREASAVRPSSFGPEDLHGSSSEMAAHSTRMAGRDELAGPTPPVHPAPRPPPAAETGDGPRPISGASVAGAVPRFEPGVTAAFEVDSRGPTPVPSRRGAAPTAPRPSPSARASAAAPAGREARDDTALPARTSTPPPRRDDTPVPRAKPARNRVPLEETRALMLEPRDETRPPRVTPNAPTDPLAIAPDDAAAAPVPAITLRLELGGTGRRALGAVVDALVILALLQGIALLGVFGDRLAVWLPLDPERLAAAALDGQLGLPFLALAMLIFTWSAASHAALGRSIGKMLTGLEVVQRATGQPIGVGRAILRAALTPISVAVAGAGYFLSILDAQHRTLHDVLAGTVVVRTRRD